MAGSFNIRKKGVVCQATILFWVRNKSTRHGVGSQAVRGDKMGEPQWYEIEKAGSSLTLPSLSGIDVPT